eukprot:2239189-Alexandrium_andersonii.AAC.1
MRRRLRTSAGRPLPARPTPTTRVSASLARASPGPEWPNRMMAERWATSALGGASAREQSVHGVGVRPSGDAACQTAPSRRISHGAALCWRSVFRSAHQAQLINYSQHFCMLLLYSSAQAYAQHFAQRDS